MKREAMFSTVAASRQGGRFGSGEGDPQWEDGNGWSEEAAAERTDPGIVKVSRMPATAPGNGRLQDNGGIVTERVSPGGGGIETALREALNDPCLLALIWLSRLSRGR